MTMKDETKLIEVRLLPFLKAKKKHYEDNGLIPTLDLLIEDLENLI